MYYLNKSESAERREERDRQLTELYCEIYDHLRSSRVNDLRQTALTITLATGTPRYHVGYDRAYIVVAKLLRDSSSVSFKSPILRDMWLEITSRVRLLVTNENMSISQAVTIVLEQCHASRFFLTEHHAWVIIKRTLSRMNCRAPYGRAA